MNFTLINKAAMRATAILTVLTMVIGVVPPRAASAADEDTAPVVKNCTVVSDASTQEGGSNTFVSSGVPPVWSSISGADWIWGDADFMNAPAGPQIFTKSFVVNGTATVAQLSLLADNSYDVRVNGSIVYIDNSENNFGLVVTHDILSKLIMNAENIIEITVTNWDGPGTNPAGLAYKIEMTGSSCTPLPIDVCSNIDGVQTTVPERYTADGSSCHPNIISDSEDSVVYCSYEKNLITNGSFEDLNVLLEGDRIFAAGGSYKIFATIPGWVSTASFEVWNGLFGGAGHAQQNLELDVDTSTQITQSISTIPGNDYQVHIAFAPRPSTDAGQNAIQLSADGNYIGLVQGTGMMDTVSQWTAHYFDFTAASTTTELGLRDVASANGLGSLLDDVTVCQIKDNTPAPAATSTISGYKFNDKNPDGIWDKDTEPGIDNWEIVLSQEGKADKYFRTNSDGSYSFIVENGSYQVSETGQKGWEQTATIGTGADGDICYITVSDRNPEARSTEDSYTCDFGNHEIEERDGGGSSTGTRVGGRRGSSRPGEVLGASTSTPTGVVLGEATSTLPVGAPNTGSGGTSPVTTTLPTIVAILPGSVRKSK